MNLPPLYTSRWSNKDLADLDAVPVGISRGTPKFKTPYRYRLVRELAPSRETFAIEGERAFAETYTAQLDGMGVDVILGRLGRVSEQHPGKPLVLLCFEDLTRLDLFCHRTMLAD